MNAELIRNLHIGEGTPFGRDMRERTDLQIKREIAAQLAELNEKFGRFMQIVEQLKAEEDASRFEPEREQPK